MNKKMITIIFVTVILLIVIVPFVLFLIPLFKNTSETYTDSDTTPTLAQLPTPPIPTSQNLLLSDRNGNLSIVKTNDLNQWATSLDQYVQKRLDDMQTEIDGKVSYNDSIALSLDHSQTQDYSVPIEPNSTVSLSLSDIDKDPKNRQYLSYFTQHLGYGNTADGCLTGLNCDDRKLRPNIFSGKPIDILHDGTISGSQSSNFKIVPGLIQGQKLQ